MPHRIISSIISSQLTGGTFLAVLGSSSQLQERVHKPSLIYTAGLGHIQYFCCSSAPDHFPFLLLLCSSPEVPEQPWAAGGGLSWSALEGPAEVFGRLGLRFPAWRKLLSKPPCAHSLGAPCRLPHFLVTRKTDDSSAQVLPSPLESHCLVLTIRWTSTSWHFPSSKEKSLEIQNPCTSVLRTFSNKINQK